MTIIEIQPLENGAHRNQTTSGNITPPEGWAVIPEGMDTPNFPFGTIEVDDSTPPIVTSWTAGEIPAPASEPIPEPTQLDRVEAQVTYTAMMTDTLLEED